MKPLLHVLGASILLLFYSVSSGNGQQYRIVTKYDPHQIYNYQFQSNTTLGDIAVTAANTIDVQVVSTTDAMQELNLKFSSFQLTFHSFKNYKNAIQPLEDNWFSVMRSDSGYIERVRYFKSESKMSLVAKNKVAKLFSIENGSDIRRNVLGDGKVSLRQEFTKIENGHEKFCTKVFLFSTDGILQSVTLEENTLHSSNHIQHKFLNSLKSVSSIYLIAKLPAPNDQSIPNDSDIVTDSTEQLEISYSLSDVDTSCDDLDDSCHQQLIQHLHQLSKKDLKSLTKKVMMSSQLDRMMSFIDAMVSSNLSDVSSLLTEFVLSDHSKADQIIQRTLYHFATKLRHFRKDSIEAIKSITNSSSFTKDTQNKALLTLGALARKANYAVSQDIVNYLHNKLMHQSSPKEKALIIDSIGNAGSTGSLQHLHHYAKSNKEDSSIRHAAIRSLRYHKDFETASILKSVAETAPSPSLQDAAIAMYKKHPLANENTLNKMEEYRGRRFRRDVEEYSINSYFYNTTMPAVNWNFRSGDNNISINLERVIHNSFDIYSEPLTTRYDFSIRDETNFAIDLQLSTGLQHDQFLQTQVCLEASTSYAANIMKFDPLLVTKQHNQYSGIIDNLIEDFIQAYSSLLSSQYSFGSVNSHFVNSLVAVQTNFDYVFSNFQQANGKFATISEGTDHRNEVLDILLFLNSSLNEIQNSFISTKESITTAVDELLPNKLQEFLNILVVDDQPFTTSSLYLPYLRYAPFKALANIYELYWNAGLALGTLENGVNNIKQLGSKFGPNKLWTNPSINLWPIEGNIGDIQDDIQLEIKAALTDGGDATDLVRLSNVIDDHLRPALATLLNSSSPLHVAITQLTNALDNVTASYDKITMSYESARSAVDMMFGQQIHPGFPTDIKPCDNDYGCGFYPGTAGGLYRNGIDLITASEVVISPFAGYIKLHGGAGNTSYSYNSTNALILTPTEFSLQSYYFVISNIEALPTFSATNGTFIKAGAVIGSAQYMHGVPTVHFEMYRIIGTDHYNEDPTDLLSTVRDVDVSVTWQCNELVTLVGDVVIQANPLISGGSSPVKTFIGEPLVDLEVPGHEFPQPYDFILEDNQEISSPTDIQFTHTSTTLIAGAIPIKFSFDSFGHHKTSVSFNAHFLTKQLNLSVTPEVWSKINGTVQVGGIIYTLVDVEGTLVDTSLPLQVKQDFNNWPLSAESEMDLILRPTDMKLTSTLVNNGEEIDYQRHWYYAIPYTNRTEFSHKGIYIDPSPPSFNTLPYYEEGDTCFVKQLVGRKYNNPAFELDFIISEPQSIVHITYQVGSYPNGFDVIPPSKLQRERIAVPHYLIPAHRLYFTVNAVNENGNLSIGTCQLPVYDRSLPLARIVPISTRTSHPNKFEALIVLFDESPLTAMQMIALGSIAGEDGNDILDWQQFDTSIINSPPSETDLTQYSFPMAGRLVGHVISVTTDVDTPAECGSMCTGNDICLSFDHSVAQKRCILHDNIEGPPYTDNRFPNNFETVPLQSSQDFYHYEKLGVGNSTLYSFTNLTLQHRRAFYININITNQLGYSNVLSSEMIIVDLTPPRPGLIKNQLQDISVTAECGFNIKQLCNEKTPIDNHRIIIDGHGSATVFNGLTPLFDALYTKINNFIGANWDGFNDKESDIRSYTWCISSSANYTCDVLIQNDPHNDQSNPNLWTNNGIATFPSIEDGPLYISVDVINGVGYGGSLVTTVHHSIPYIVDTTPPSVTYFNVDAYDNVQNKLNVSFNVSDAGSGISAVNIAVGTSTDSSDILPWTFVTNQSGWVDASVDVLLLDGVDSFVKLQVLDKVKLENVTVSPVAINTDRSSPVIGILRDGNDISTDLDYQPDAGTICMSWAGVVDPHSDIIDYQWGIGLAFDDSEFITLKNLTDDEIAIGTACHDFTLMQNVKYYSTLIVTNSAGLVTTRSTDGVTIDVTPPIPGVVIDGGSIAIDIQYSNSLTRAAFTWQNFTDPESSIGRYRIFIYHRPQFVSLSSLIRIETVQSVGYSSNEFSFSNGDFVYATVEGVNNAGIGVNSSSDGYLIDITSPLVQYLIDGSDVMQDINYQSSTTSLSASWSVYDLESSVSDIRIAIFQVDSEGNKVRIYPNPEFEDITYKSLPVTSSNFTVDELDLSHGSTYIFSVLLTNRAGIQAAYETNGVQIDSVPPTMSTASVLGDPRGPSGVTTVTSSQTIEGEWSGSDDGTAISKYLVAVLTEDNIFVTDSYIDFGASQRGRIDKLNLTLGNTDDGPFYKIRVIAVDEANLSSSPLDSSLFSVSDQSMYVPFIETYYTEELSSISAYFEGFSISECSGISAYQWAIGTTPDMLESIVPFTHDGIYLLSNSSGRAQLFIHNLQDYLSSNIIVTIRVSSPCGDVAEFTSPSFVLDPHPPVVSILKSGYQSVENVPSETRHSVYQSIETFSTVWVVKDSTSMGELDNWPVNVSIGSYPRGSDFYNQTNLQSNYIRSSIDIEGLPNYVTVAAANSAGIQSYAVSDPVVMDTSLPSIGQINCSTAIYSTANWISLSMAKTQLQFTCQLSEVKDIQSAIDHYTVSIMMDKSLYSMFIVPGRQYSFVSPVIDHKNNSNYYITLDIANGAGLINILTSSMLALDLTRPESVGPLIVMVNHDSSYYDIDGEGPVCLWWTSTLLIQFEEFIDEESGIKDYQLAIGTSSGTDDIHPYRIIQPSKNSTTYTVRITELSSSLASVREPVFFTIRGTNNALQYTDLTSRPHYIKSNINIKQSVVYDGRDLYRDIDYQNYETYISGHFHYGIHCPLRTIQWAVEGADGVRLKDFSKIPLENDILQEQFSFSSDQVRLHDQETYRLVVQGIDYADEVHIFRSNGTAVSIRGLQPGDVLDGHLSDLKFQDSLMSLTFRIANFGDGSAEQTIEYYEVALGTDPQYSNTLSNIVPFVNIGLETTYTFTDINLIAMDQVYYVTVRAHSSSGAVAQVTSNGISAGYDNAITAGKIFQTPFQFNTSFLNVHWMEFQSDVPILYYDWAISDHLMNSSLLLSFCSDVTNDFSDSFVYSFTNVDLSTFASAVGLNLKHNQSYLAVIRAIDAAGKCKTVISRAPTLIDVTGPAGHGTTVGPPQSYTGRRSQYIAYLQVGRDLVLNWDNFTDLESPVDHYEIAVLKLESCSPIMTGEVISDSLNIGLATSYAFKHLALEANVTYVAQIRATNKAGLTSHVLSEPFMLDTHKLTAGTVKDGSAWSGDVAFQSDVHQLAGVFSLAYMQPLHDNESTENPCPDRKTFPLNESYSSWSASPPSVIDGGGQLALIRYESGQTSIESTGTTITAVFDPTDKVIVSGTYAYSGVPSFKGYKTFSITIAATQGDLSLAQQTITSLLFIDSSVSDLLVVYDESGAYSSPFIALGVQLHNGYNDSQQRVVLWSKSTLYSSKIQTASRNVSINLAEFHLYELLFTDEPHGLNKVDLLIDGIHYLSLYGAVPSFTNDAKLILHVFNRRGFLPECNLCADDPPKVFAKFSNISFPVSTGGVCDYGYPFYSWGSPIIDIQAAVGTKPGLTDVKKFESIYKPCLPCRDDSCYQYGCDPLCPMDGDPSIVPFTLHITDMLTSDINDTSSASGNDSSGAYPEYEAIKPGTYYITLMATTASGQTSLSSSNGVLIDDTPPVLSLPIRHYDVDFSLTQSTSYQGNNHTIAASWTFDDPESRIIEYQWAIGSVPFGKDIQGFESVGLDTRAINDGLDGILRPNGTYYVTVLAINGAGLSNESTSSGITYMLIHLNQTMLDLSVKVNFVQIINDVAIDGRTLQLLISDSIAGAGVQWRGVPNDISNIFWYIGSEPGYEDILPLIDVSYSTNQQAAFDNGVLYFGSAIFSNLSDLNTDISDTEGIFFEPGRLFYHTVQFCTLAHNCITSDPRTSIVIRSYDGQQRSSTGDDISMTITQVTYANISDIIPVLDKNYTITLNTTNGLDVGTAVFSGFLQDDDVKRSYRINTPYISNPYVTMGQTSRIIARRFIAIGGPSFYVSFIGQESLHGQLKLNITFDSTLDWSDSEPTIGYWDIDVNYWREVTSTCVGTTSTVDYTTSTISVDVCSTVLDPSSAANRPVSLSRRKRLVVGSGAEDTSNVTEYLGRPTQFIVMKIGNFSFNTAPQLSLPSLIELDEDVTLFTYNIPYTDSEGDGVHFYLMSVPRLGVAIIDNVTGILTYHPCRNCSGIETLQIYIIERDLAFGTALHNTGILQLRINNRDDQSEIFLYETISFNETSISNNRSVTVYIESNRTGPVTVARVGAYDVDGYNDNLEFFVTQGAVGTSGYVTWLDAVGIAESLPVDWSQLPINNFTGYVSFLGANITYIPNSPDFVGTDVIRVYSQQSDNSFSTSIGISVEVVPSWCLNGGTCGGSPSDPACTNITARRADPGSYTCSCPSGFAGVYCENDTSPSIPQPSVCPDNIPLMTCDGDPCAGATCPGHPDAVCIPNYCGHCIAEWYIGSQKVQCSARNSSVCKKLVHPSVTDFCRLTVCDCPEEHFICPEDSIYIETRVNQCCVTYTCMCPNISCPLLMECGHGVQPIPDYRGGSYPGRCCPQYSFQDIDECSDSSSNICSHTCTNSMPLYACECPLGKTLALDGKTCGVCNYGGQEYLFGDTVKIGCNWCVCQEDDYSQERWHCTAEACDPGCYHDGAYYDKGSIVNIASNNCTCQPTTFLAEWNCQFNLQNN